eukprot:s5640_g2.t1
MDAPHQGLLAAADLEGWERHGFVCVDVQDRSLFIRALRGDVQHVQLPESRVFRAARHRTRCCFHTLGALTALCGVPKRPTICSWQHVCTSEL